MVDCLKSGPGPRGPGSGPVRSGPAPDFVGPGPGGEWTRPWGRTGVGPGPNLYFQFIILCTVSNIILSFCNRFQEGRAEFEIIHASLQQVNDTRCWPFFLVTTMYHTFL